MDNASGYRPMLRQRMDHRVQSAIVSACGDIYVQTRFGIIGMQLPEDCDVALPAELSRDEIERLRADPDVLQHLRFQSSTLRTRLTAIETAIEGTRNTLLAVQAANGGRR